MYTRHHKNAHPESRAEFEQISTEKKSIYFDKTVSHDKILLAQSDSNGVLILNFSRHIVENFIGDLLFHGDGEVVHSIRAWVLSVLEMHEDALPQDNIEV